MVEEANGQAPDPASIGRVVGSGLGVSHAGSNAWLLLGRGRCIIAFMISESDDRPEPSVLVVEEQRAVQSVLRGYLETGGFRVEVRADMEAALTFLVASSVDVVLAGAETSERVGEKLCQRIKSEVSSRIPVVLLYAPGEEEAERRSTMVGADGYLVAPIKKHAVLTVLRGMLRIRLLLDQIDTLERALEEATRSSQPQSVESSAVRPKVAGDVAYDFDFFKRLLLMEVKRSKRYAYPISLAIVAFDGLQELAAELDVKERGRVVGSLLAQITLCIRDIDLPVLYAEDKILVFMPHTPRDGAMVVGERLCDRLRNHSAEIEDGRSLRLTGSIGVAAFDGHGTVSFGGLIKDALFAVRKVQMDGGDGVAVSGDRGESRATVG